MVEEPTLRGYGYAVFTLHLDEDGYVQVPVGVALWNEELEWAAIKFVEEHHLGWLGYEAQHPLVDIAVRQIRQWMVNCEPQAAFTEPYPPYFRQFWQTVEQRLLHSVRLFQSSVLEDHSDAPTALQNTFMAVVLHKLEKLEQLIMEPAS